MNKKKNSFWKRGMVLAIICLFIGAGVVPSISGDINDKKTNLDEILVSDNKEGSSAESATDWWPMFHHDLSHSGYSTSDAPETNNVKWSYSTGDWVVSSPAVADGKVYIGSLDHYVYCLDAETGNKIWSYATGASVDSSPAVADGKVYIGSYGKVYCLDAATGDLIWSYTIGSDVYSSPAVADGKVYIGSYDDKVYCLDAATGDLIWSYTTGNVVYSSPAVADGKVYIGSYDDKVYCLNAATGDLIWSYSTGGWVYSSPAVCDGKVYVGSYDNKVYCLDAATGDFIWSYTTGDWVSSSPAVVDGKVYVGSDNGRLYCLDAATGDFIWSYTTGNVVCSSPAVADGKVYIGSEDDKVYCLNAATGDFIWSYTTGNYVDSSPAVADGKVYIGSKDNKVYCFEDSGNQPPNTPSKPSGQTSGIVHHSYAYQTSAEDPDGDRVQYYFGWGDETGDWTGFVDSGQNEYCDHIWRGPGDYQVKAKARDENGAESGWSEPLTVTVEEEVNHQPNKPNKPSGQESGKAGVRYNYSTSAVDPDGDQIKYYLWDWGDGVDNRSTIYGPFDSGQTVEMPHIWDKKGSYEVKVWAIDLKGAQSYHSDPLLVSMPKGELYFGPLFRLFERFIGRYPWIKHLINIQDKNYTFSHHFCGSSEYGLTVSTRGWSHANQEGTAVTIYGDINALSLWINLKGFFCYDTVDHGASWQAYAYQTPEVDVDFLSKNFDYTISGLIRTNKYYYIAVGKNIKTNEIKGADNRNSFISGSPDVETSDADYGLTWMTPEGKLTHMGGASSCEVWFEYGTSEGNLNKESSHQTFTSIGEFSTTLDELTSCKTIYFRAVVSNDCGTTRGNTKNATPGKPNVATGSASEQNTTSVYLNGNLNHLGGASGCEVWFEYGKSSDNLNKESSHQTFTSIGEFSIYITGLMRGETYYFRAVANNNVCRDYGNIESFTLTESYPPDMPTIVEGETFGVVNCYYRYVVTTTDPEHDRVQYYFDWGDGTGDWTDFYDSGDKGQGDHAWREPRVYEVRAKAKDEKGVESIWSRSLNVTIDEKPNNPPNKPSTPSGPTTGRAGVRYTYCTCATDPDGDQIAYYLWDWGDGRDKRTTTWGPFDSGETVCENHTWSSRDRYEIVVWAIDVDGAISDSSDPLTVTLPKSMLGDKPKCCWSFQISKNCFPWIGHIFNIQNCSYILSHHFCSNSNSGDVEMEYYSP